MPGMTFHDKASVLLVQAKLKPSALIVMEGDTFSDTKHPKHVDPKLLVTMDAIFTELGIHYVKTTEVMDAIKSGIYVEVLRFFIAPEPTTAKTLKSLFDDTSNNHTSIGLLLGYPKTAVEAFLTPNMLDQAETPETTDDVSKFRMRLLGHRLSKDHWGEEVKYLQPSGEYIKSISPYIYNKLTKEE